MTAQQLKNSILQMAVQGKLVPQDPSDEPASALLARIRAEKEEMVKEGEIKKEKNPSVIFRGDNGLFYEKVGDQTPVCIEDELPFEIPESWAWIRPEDIGFFSSGQTPKATSLYSVGKYPYFKVADMNTLGNEKYLHITKNYLSESYHGKLFRENTIVFPKNGGAVFTNKKRILSRESLVDLNTGAFTPYGFVDLEYLFLLFQTIDFTKFSKGTALPTVDLNSVKKILWALPPLTEQQRIVAKYNSLNPFIEQYEDTLHKLDTLAEEFPNLLKKSILQFAVQGKLVPQDLSDEPASVLLERIRAEKEQLIKSGKIKRDKHESVICKRDDSYYEKVDGVERCIDDEIPFDIPESWEWVRFSNLIKLKSGIDFKPENYNDLGIGIPYITGASNLDKDGVIVTRWTDAPQNIANKGDVLLVCKGSGYGKTVICNVNSAHIARQIMAIKKNNYLDMEYVKYFLQANINYLKSKGQGVIPGIDRESILNMMFPLPPLEEQKRIVEKLSLVDEKIDCF